MTETDTTTPKRLRKRRSSDPVASAIAMCRKALEPLTAEDREDVLEFVAFVAKRGKAKT